VGLPAQLLSDDAIQSYLDKYTAAHGRQLNCFYQLRALLAPVVESVILLDRLLFMLEHPDTRSASLVKLFDPVTSPRCYALVATKF
jgi:hypothetical protein